MDADGDAPKEWLLRGPASRVALPLELFESRYEGYSLEELESRLEEVTRGMREERARLFQERYDAGLYELHPYPADGSELTLRQASSGPSTMVVSTDSDRGHAHVLFLPFDEYPEHYETLDEWAWLRFEIRRLQGNSLSLNRHD